MRRAFIAVAALGFLMPPGRLLDRPYPPLLALNGARKSGGQSRFYNHSIIDYKDL